MSPLSGPPPDQRIRTLFNLLIWLNLVYLTRSYSRYIYIYMYMYIYYSNIIYLVGVVQVRGVFGQLGLEAEHDIIQFSLILHKTSEINHRISLSHP